MANHRAFRTKYLWLGLVVGINAARSGQTYGLYYEKAGEGLLPLQPFPPAARKLTLQEVAARLPAPQTLGEKIRFLRMRKGLRQNELAKALGVYSTAVCQWEKGLTEPRPEHLSRLGKLFAGGQALHSAPLDFLVVTM